MDPLNALGPGVEVVKSVWPFFGRRINYLRKLSGNVITLRRKNDELVARESDIRQEIRRSEAQEQKANNRVRQLLAEVGEVRQRVTAVIASLEHNRRPIYYYCWSRFKLAKKVVLVTQDVDRLLQETSAFGSGLVVQQSPPRAQLLPTTTPIGESTVQKNLDAVLKSLQDPKMRRIGVHGMGGSGKTATMKEINNQLRRKEDFDKIIWVTVSKDWNLQKVQSDIAGQVNLDLSKNVDNEFRAGQLFKRLQGAKRFLLVLDDMWDRIDLQKLGIPEPNVENKCKIVLTTRSLQVCRLMETDDDIKLNLLSKEEAWELFVSKAGEEALIPKVRPLAEKVASECACLPLAIITVGRAMRKTKDIRAWRTALEDLKISEPDIPDMEEEVFNLLRFSYNRLRNDSVRKCFLNAALFQEDSWIPEDRLISYWIGDGLIKEKGDLTRERDECHKILRDLHDANMFQRFYGNIIMHDVLRDLAIRIMGEEGGVVKAGLELRQAPRRNEWNLANKISLVKNKMLVLEDQPTCPNLSILLLWANPLENIVRDSFFDQMPCLQVLDLCYTKVRKLPSSLSNLVNLRALFLQHCYELKEIPSLARLEKLQLLDLTATSIQKIPQGVDRLSNLRSLDLSLTRCLEECTIFKNAHLEELDLAGSKVFYVMDSGKVVECMKELRSLNSLRILSMSLTLDAYLNALMGLQWEQFQNYVIHIHDPTKDRSTLTTLGPKYFQMDSQNISNHGSSFFFPQNTRTLHIKNCEIPRLSEFMSNMRSLKVCILDHCLLSSENDGLLLGEEMGEYTFTRLERLSLVDIKEVTSIWKGVVPHHACFINLKSLNVYCLHQLKYLGFISFVQHLKNIEDIQVTCCSTLEVLVTSDGEDHGFENANSTKTITLLKLHTLTLADLPELHSISTDIVWICDSLRQLTVENCPKLKSLPFSIDSLSNLAKIRGQTQWWDELEWNDPDIKSLLSPRLQDPDLLYARVRPLQALDDGSSSSSQLNPSPNTCPAMSLCTFCKLQMILSKSSFRQS